MSNNIAGFTSIAVDAFRSQSSQLEFCLFLIYQIIYNKLIIFQIADSCAYVINLTCLLSFKSHIDQLF